QYRPLVSFALPLYTLPPLLYSKHSLFLLSRVNHIPNTHTHTQHNALLNPHTPRPRSRRPRNMGRPIQLPTRHRASRPRQRQRRLQHQYLWPPHRPPHRPPSDCISVWHPPHPDVYIDDCDSNKEHGWHWVHPGKPTWGGDGGHKWKKPKHTKKPGCDKCEQPTETETAPSAPEPTETPDQPEQPEPTTTPQSWKWTTSTITQTAVSTIYSCPPSVPNCPGNGGGTMYETVTVPAVVTICPVPVEPNPGPT
ncbi:hypothetical protein BDP81DRAFT_487350, partial [Colletotrichum phormii]